MDTKRSIVVADGDPWVYSALAAVMASEGYEIVPCTTARGALNACCALDAECLITELTLPDLDGLWLLARVREEPGPVAQMPVVMATVDRDESTRVAALTAGADVFVAKPLRILEVVAQIKALVAMARRLRAERPSVLPPMTEEPRRAIHGDLSRMTVATVLGALELERRSGDLILPRSSGARERLVLELASGLLVGGKLVARGDHVERLSPIDALRHALDWTGTRFEFVAKVGRVAPRGAEPFGKLMFRLIQIDEPRVSFVSLSDIEAPPAALFAPSSKSGMRPKLPPPPPPANRLRGPGAALVEPVVPRERFDPRAEPDEALPPHPRPAPKLAKR
jgi:DNA-binding response OmpR family regulator